MGRVARWLRNLWSGSKENKEPRHSTNNGREHRPEKKRWSFRKSRDSAELALGGHNASTASSIEAAWFQSLYAESDKERSKHAIAVAAAAAADAAAAEAAVAAAEAAVAAVRLAGKGTGGVDFAGSLEQLDLAAERIQTAFRGYLARKARRALKALVKLQALVRGYLVRKQVAATLHGMQALVRAQATIRAQKCRSLLLEDSIYFPEIRHRRSLERFTDPRSAPRRLSTSVDGARGTKTVEIDTYGTRPCQVPPRISIPSRRVFEDNHDYLTGEKCRVSATAHSTPRCVGPFDYVAVTPAKSVCVGEGVFRQYSSSPSYVINTKSSMAKQRPQSEVMRKRQPLSELTVDARAGNLGGNSKLHKNGSLAQEAVEFKRAVVGKLEREIYLQRKW